MSHDCENLDPFLSDDLSDEATEHFEAHLAHCAVCRDAVDRQRWIDGLLTSPERIELESLPTALPYSMRTSIAWRRRKTSALACGLAAAAVLVVAVGWTALLSGQARGPGVREMASGPIGVAEPSPRPSVAGRETGEPPRATFVGGPDVIVVPVESRHPDVTIVRLFPTYKPSLASKANGESSDADHFNGG